jgi:catechol 2,3-dioxygenase-like lactoylglutathione lyase family enzyme
MERPIHGHEGAIAMTTPTIRQVKSIVLTTDDLERTAAFYRDVLGLPLELERHRGTVAHYAGQVGAMHFALHERATFWLKTQAAPSGDAIVSFTIDDADAFVAHLAARGVEITERTKIGPMAFVAFRDPDGRHVCCGTPWPDRASR